MGILSIFLDGKYSEAYPPLSVPGDFVLKFLHECSVGKSTCTRVACRFFSSAVPRGSGGLSNSDLIVVAGIVVVKEGVR